MQHPASKALPQGLPNCLKKRRLLNDKELKPEACREYGEKFLSLGWWEDSLEFFRKADDANGLEKIRDHCLQTGDAYLLARTGRQPPEVWHRLADKALALGKFHFARKGFEMAGDAEKAALAQSMIAGEAATDT